MAELLDNREKRVAQLKEIIQGLHSGAPEDEVRTKLRELVKQTDASEIAAMEQQLIDDGMAAEEITAMCDMHSQVLRDIIVERPHDPITPGHPVDTFRKENEAIREGVAGFREAMSEVLQGEDVQAVDPVAAGNVQRIYNDMMDLDKHYARKENLLFPFLEKHNITGPSKVMWAKDDEIRGKLKSLGALVVRHDATVADWREAQGTTVEPALESVEEMVHKEENILLPMALDSLTEVEWGEIWSASPEVGYCLVEPGTEYRPATQLIGIEGADAPAAANGGSFISPTGALSMDQIKGILNTLPIDATFVDADDRVKYFTEGADRVFARPKTIIGRKVQHCHPPSSVDVVERILSDFKSGKEDACSFWIELKGRFVCIQYFAVRDENKAYLGTLEITQDATWLRSLEGERRLLDYNDK
jgi:uncharacterized protein